MGVVGVRLETALVGEGKHLVVHLCRIAYAQHIDATVDELFRYPVDSHVALCTDKYLVLALQCLKNCLNKCRCLAGSGRTMYNGYVLSAKHLVDGVRLRVVEKRERHGLEGECLCLLTGIEQVAQVAQASFCTYGALQCLEHQPVARLVEAALHRQPFRRLHTHYVGPVRNSNYHSVTINKTHHALHSPPQGGVGGGHNLHRPTKLKVVVDVLVFGAHYLNGELVERVVVAA